MNRNRIILIITIIFGLIVTIGISYAYFTANITGVESSSTISVSGGSLTLTMNGGNNITVSDIAPGDLAIATKTITVTGNNTTETLMPYTMKLIIESNTFSTGSITYTLTSTNTDSTGKIIPSISTNTSIVTGANTIIFGSGSFSNASSKTHTYVLRLYFLDNNNDQNSEQGKSLSAHVELIAETAVKLPYGYSQLNYIQNTGSQYINTEYIPNNSTKIQARIAPIVVTGSQYFYGARETSSSTIMLAFSGSSGNNNYSTSLNGNSTTASMVRISGHILDIEQIITSNLETVRLESTIHNTTTGIVETIYSSYNAGINNNTLSLYLFAFNTSNRSPGMRVYSFKIIENGVLLKDFIPARRNSDNVLGLFDLINSVFYTNAGSGTFTAGSEI